MDISSHPNYLGDQGCYVSMVLGLLVGQLGGWLPTCPWVKSPVSPSSSREHPHPTTKIGSKMGGAPN